MYTLFMSFKSSYNIHTKHKVTMNMEVFHFLLSHIFVIYLHLVLFLKLSLSFYFHLIIAFSFVFIIVILRINRR